MLTSFEKEPAVWASVDSAPSRFRTPTPRPIGMPTRWKPKPFCGRHIEVVGDLTIVALAARRAAVNLSHGFCAFDCCLFTAYRLITLLVVAFV